MRYSEHDKEVTSQQVDSGIATWMKCVNVSIIWKILHSRWRVLLELEWSALQWILYGRYFTAGWHRYCSLNEVRYTENYVEDTSQQMDSSIAAWMKCVRVNMIRKYFTAGGQLYCSLNEVRCSEYYMEDNSQQVDTGIAASMNCVTVNIIWKIFHSRWTVELQLEWRALQ